MSPSRIGGKFPSLALICFGGLTPLEPVTDAEIEPLLPFMRDESADPTAAERYTPIMMLTSKSSEIDRVLGLELGADDYLTKPFSMLELAARVKGVFRRADLAADPKKAAADEKMHIESDGLRIDLERHEAQVRGQLVELTAKEFELLACFARCPGRVFTRTQLLDQVWGYSHAGYEHTVNTHINRLRNKIERDPANPEFIQTVWGVGYKFGGPGE